MEYQPPRAARQSACGSSNIHGANLFRVEVFRLETWHVLRESEGAHFERDSTLYDILQLIFCMARAELPRMAVHREGHDQEELDICGHCCIHET